MRASGRSERTRSMTLKAVRRWKVMTERPTTSGCRSRTSRSTVPRTRPWARMRSATATRWWASTLPARDVSAPFGMRVVSAGMGDKWGEKETRMYRLDRSTTLLGSLQAAGVAPEDIDLVVNTHLHFDHAGGNTRVVDGKTVPTFPRARYVVQMGEWEDATHPHERSRASYRDENFVPLAESRQLETVQGEAEVAPGVRVVPVGGHTAYHQMVVI